MVDLKGQYDRIKDQIGSELSEVMEGCSFINGPKVQEFAKNLSNYTGAKYVIPCANGTDALMIALMALGLKRGDEVILPAFTYVATAEVIGLLGLTPVMIDVDADTFNLSVDQIEKVITPNSKAIVPVHLYGQCCNMSAILQVAKKYSLFVVEDNAQALGAQYTFEDGRTAFAGTMGDIGCTSFFPSKNLGCYGDGGAIFTNDADLAERIKMIANHGQRVKYYHEVIGCNSRLDTVQAAVLNVKLRYLDDYSRARYSAAMYYNERLESADPLKNNYITPSIKAYSSHVFHQYTLRIMNNRRDELKEFLAQRSIPSMIYYPLPLDRQKAFTDIVVKRTSLDNSHLLCGEVLSLPIHTEMNREIQDYIVDAILEFFK